MGAYSVHRAMYCAHTLQRLWRVPDTPTPHALKGRDSGFSAPTCAGTPLRLCPSEWLLFLAALWSRCKLVLQSRHACQRTDKSLWTSTPQPEQACEVEAGGTATTLRPGARCLVGEAAQEGTHSIP